MPLLKKLAGLAVGAAAVGAAVYVLQNREHHDDEYEHIWGSEDEVEPETDSAEPADDASAVAEPAPAAAPEECPPAAPGCRFLPQKIPSRPGTPQIPRVPDGRCRQPQSPDQSNTGQNHHTGRCTPPCRGRSEAPPLPVFPEESSRCREPLFSCPSI